LTSPSGKRHKEAAAAFVAGGGDASGVARHRRVFVLQQSISALAKHLKPVIDATKNFTQKKLTLTYEELQQVAPYLAFFGSFCISCSICPACPTLVRQERQLEEEPVDSESDAEGEEVDGDAPIYNPKNVPLGWDGKPIPYWLYKLHGLNIEYKCEICGNFSYWGPRNFDRHFQE
jgi:splicing factor 3A subunit 3